DGVALSNSATVTFQVSDSAPAAPDRDYTIAAGGYLSTSNQGFYQGILANNPDPDGDVMSVDVETGVSHGVLNTSESGNFTYISQPGYAGTDSFTYRTFDGTAFSTPGTVTIEIASPGGTAASNTYNGTSLPSSSSGFAAVSGIAPATSAAFAGLQDSY